MDYLVSFSYGKLKFHYIVKDAEDEILAIKQTKKFLHDEKEWTEDIINSYSFSAKNIKLPR